MNALGTVLLTGSSGFTGRYVRPALQAAGYRVIGLSNGSPEADEIRGDLENLDSLRAAVAAIHPDYVIHLAGIAFVAHSDPMDFYRVNLFGTLNLLQALKDSGLPLRKLVLASSAAIYGQSPVSPVSENACPAPANHYAMSKLAMEQLAKPWINELPVVIARPFNYTGPGQNSHFLIPKLIEHFGERKASLRLGNTNVVREFNDVRMVADVYRRLMADATPGTIVNICTGNGHALADIISLLERMTGHHPILEADSSLMRAGEARELVGDDRHLDKIVPHRRQFSLEETLEYMLASLPGSGDRK